MMAICTWLTYRAARVSSSQSQSTVAHLLAFLRLSSFAVLLKCWRTMATGSVGLRAARLAGSISIFRTFQIDLMCASSNLVVALCLRGCLKFSNYYELCQCLHQYKCRIILFILSIKIQSRSMPRRLASALFLILYPVCSLWRPN